MNIEPPAEAFEPPLEEEVVLPPGPTGVVAPPMLEGGEPPLSSTVAPPAPVLSPPIPGPGPAPAKPRPAVPESSPDGSNEITLAHAVRHNSDGRSHSSLRRRIYTSSLPVRVYLSGPGFIAQSLQIAAFARSG